MKILHRQWLRGGICLGCLLFWLYTENFGIRCFAAAENASETAVENGEKSEPENTLEVAAKGRAGSETENTPEVAVENTTDDAAWEDLNHPDIFAQKQQNEESLAALLLDSPAGLAAGQQKAELAAARIPFLGELPETYDARTIGKEPVIKSQGSFGTCWALTVTSALEAALMPEQHLVFSADHLSLNNGFVIDQSEGGDYVMAMAYLSSWRGPVLESEDPYGDGSSPEGLSAAVHVQEMRLLENRSATEIKEMIYQYGPVQTSLYMDRRTTSATLNYYQEEQDAFYYPDTETPTHDILILGWDDTYSRTNFATEPAEDGAWICQNTWGESFGAQGIFYVSYDDANIARGGVAYTKVEAADNYDRIYQTDVCGWQGQQGYETETCYFANVYTAEAAEQLKAVGFYTTDVNSSYEVYTVTDYEDESSFAQRSFAGRGWQKYAGYYTVPLQEPVSLEAGERFAVIVKITTPGATKPVAVELRKDSYTQNVSLDGQQGYLSLYGEAWEYTEEKFQTNVCLKAYTTQ